MKNLCTKASELLRVCCPICGHHSFVWPFYPKCGFCHKESLQSLYALFCEIWIELGNSSCNTPSLLLFGTQKPGENILGSAGGSTIILYPDAIPNVSRLLEVLIHECIHIVVPGGHTEDFVQLLVSEVNRLFGTQVTWEKPYSIELCRLLANEIQLILNSQERYTTCDIVNDLFCLTVQPSYTYYSK